MAIQLHFDKSAQQLVKELKVRAVNVLTLVTHHNPHHDELVAFTLFIEFCSKMFPNIHHLCFDFLVDGKPYRGKDFDANLRDGYLCIGIGGGPLDEHGRPGQDRQIGKCSATLVSEYLGVASLPVLQDILDSTSKADLNRVTDPSHAACAVKRMYREGKVFEDTFKRIREDVLSSIAEQNKFFAAKEDFDRAIIEHVEYSKGKSFKVVSAVTDNPFFAKYARSKYGCQAAVIIQMTSSGNVQIGSNGFYKNLPFSNIACLVRLAEFRQAGNKAQMDLQLLSTAENIESDEIWHFQIKGGNLMNGSETRPNVPPTKLSMERLRSIVKTALTPELFARAIAIIQSKQAA